jgi:hypothetical protein
LSAAHRKNRENDVKNTVVCAILLATLFGCTTAPIPKDYSGPIATIRDTAVSETSNRAQFYFLGEIDDRKVDNVLFATRKANRGQGFSLSPVVFSRDVPARASKLKLEARIGYGAPLQEMLNTGTLYVAEAMLSFTPESNKTYVVKGTLTAEKQEVWLEEAETGKRVD